MPIRTVAFSGQQAPGTPHGVNFSSLSAPLLNSNGTAAFDAQLHLGGPGVTPENVNGTWVEGAGGLRLAK